MSSSRLPISRRTLLAAGAAGLALPGVAWASESDLPSLDMLARAKGMRFGSAMGAKGGFGDPQYRALMAQQCGVMTPENELKWGWVRRGGATSFDFTGADALIAFAEANDMAFRGHNLLWHRDPYVPEWVGQHDYGAHPATEAARLIREHIQTVCSRYGTRIASYDVVNEAVDDKTGLLRQTLFSRHLAPQEAVDLAFRTAREAAPHAQLVYNDFMSWEPGSILHREGVLRLLEGFRARGVPVDALGVQSHIGDPIDKTTPFGLHDEAEWRRFLDRVTGMGYTLLITELDVSDKRLPAPVPARDKAVADYARAYLDVMLSYPQMGDVVAWGLTDQYSWLRGLTPRADGELKRPTPYDDRFQPKPLRTAIAEAFKAAPARIPTLDRRLTAS